MRCQAKNSPGLKNNVFDPKNVGGSGMYALPGTYFVSLAMDQNGEITQLVGPVNFIAKPLNNTTLPAIDRKALDVYQDKVPELA